jgi:hypothetical protein
MNYQKVITDLEHHARQAAEFLAGFPDGDEMESEKAAHRSMVCAVHALKKLTDKAKTSRAPKFGLVHGSALWQPAATAPKTRVILADTGYPWPLPCLWDAEAGKWAVAFLNVENQNSAKESQNVWWETEYECAITAWAEMPATLHRGEGRGQ